MNAGSFRHPVAVFHSGSTCQLQGTQQKISHMQIASSLSLHLGWSYPSGVSGEGSQSASVLQSTALAWRHDRQADLDTKSLFGHAG